MQNYHKKRIPKSSLFITFFIFLLLGLNLININATATVALSTKLKVTTLGELDYPGSDFVKQAIRNKNANLSYEENQQLIVGFVGNENKATITSTQLTGQVEVTFSIKPRLNSILLNTNLGEILANSQKIKEAIQKLNTEFDLSKATIENITDTSATVKSSQGTGDIIVSFTKRPFLANVQIDDEVKDEFRHIFEYIKHHQNYKQIGAPVCKGYLLHGPPGTGKTYLVEQLRDELGDNIYYKEYAGPEFTSASPGVGESKVRVMFEEARKQQKPCIIAIDEIDSILSKRGETSNDSGGAVRGHNSLVNQFLAELDGLKKTDYPIIVIGMTNKDDILDDAVTRPGRIEKKIFLGLPNRQNTRLILEMFLKKITLDPDLTTDGKTPKDNFLTELSQKCFTLKMSPASLKYFTQEAARIAVKTKNTVSLNDLEVSLERYQQESLKKIIKTKDMSNSNFSKFATVLKYTAIAALIIAVSGVIYMMYRKYKQKVKLKAFEKSQK